MKNDYRTKQKAAVLKLLTENAQKHITAADIISALEKNGSKVSTATVYRHLEKLVSDGTVKKYITDSGSCFQYTGCECNNHFHLKCTSCGALIHVDCSFLDNLAPHIMEHHNFALDNRRTIMYGLCKACR